MATPPFLLPYPFPYPSQDSWLPWMWFPWHPLGVAPLGWTFPGCRLVSSLGMDALSPLDSRPGNTSSRVLTLPIHSWDYIIPPGAQSKGYAQASSSSTACLEETHGGNTNSQVYLPKQDYTGYS